MPRLGWLGPRSVLAMIAAVRQVSSGCAKPRRRRWHRSRESGSVVPSHVGTRTGAPRTASPRGLAYHAACGLLCGGREIAERMSPVGSRAGAVFCRPGLSVAPRFLWECLTSPAVNPSPTPATSNGAGGFPALRSPARFTPRLMRPTQAAALGAVPTATTYSTWSARHSLPPGVYPPAQVLQIDGCFYHGTPASPVAAGVTSSRAPSLHGRYSASSLLRTHPPPSRRRPTSRCYRLFGLPRFRPFGSGRGGFLQLLAVPVSPCCR